MTRYMDLCAPTIVEFPSRWTIQKHDTVSAARELSSLAETLVKGCEAIHSLYMRMCDLIRQNQLSDNEVRKLLEKHFPHPRISEILRVSRAPDEVYRRYRAGFFGFKAALAECRGFTINSTSELTRRKIRRCAERLVLLLDGPGKLEIRGRVVSVALAVRTPVATPESKPKQKHFDGNSG